MKLTRINFLKSYLLLISLFVTSSSTIAAGDKVGNGGYIDGLIISELNDRTTIDINDIDKITKDVGEELKNTTLIPLFKRFLADTKIGADLMPIQEYLKQNENKLFLDIKLSHILSGACPNNATTCTGDKLYSKIIIDKSAIRSSRFGITISELISLITHEYLHHLFEKIPNHDDYLMTKQMKKYIIAKDYKTISYNLYDTIIELNGRSHIYYSSNSSQIRLKAYANHFCRYKGHKSAKSYNWTSLSIYHYEFENHHIRRLWRLQRLATNNFKIRVFDSAKKVPMYTLIECNL